MNFVLLCVVLRTFWFCFFSYSQSLSNNSSGGTSESTLMPFSTLVLTSWDHSLVSSEAISNLSKGITNTLKVVIVTSKIVRTLFDRTK